MLKKFVSSFLALMILVGCSGGSSSSRNSAESIAQGLIKDLKLEDKVAATEQRILQGLMFFPEDTVDDASLYLSNDKKADVVGVFHLKDAKRSQEVLDCVEAYRQTLKAQMESYAPGETFKVDSAIVEVINDYVIFVICDSLEDARKAVEKL